MKVHCIFTSKLILIERMGKRKRNCRVPLKARPKSMHNIPHVETLWMLSRVFQPCAEKWWVFADDQGEGEKGWPGRQITYCGYRPWLRAPPYLEHQWRGWGKSRKRPKVSSHLNIGASTTSVTNIDSQKTLNHKMTKLPLSLSRKRLSK